MRISIFITMLLYSTFTYSQVEDRGYIIQVGDTVPNFKMELTTGEIVKISDLRGKVVMLQFTASWCGVCRKEMPFIEDEIWLKLKNRNDFALFGIDRDEPLEKVKEFIDKMKITYPVALDPDAKIFQLFALEEAGVTRNVIINQKGEIIYLTRLFNTEEFEAMKKVIFNLVEQ